MSGLKAQAALAALLAAFLCSAFPALAQQDSAILFRNVKIFDGKSGALTAPSNVLVRDGKIATISTADITATGQTTAAQTIDGGGRAR